MRFTRPLAAAAALTTLALAACQGTSEPGSGKPPAELTSLPRPLTAAESRVSSAANAFTFSLFARLNEAQRGVNVFASPLSASMALGMTMNGADAATLEQMRAALQVAGASDADVNAGYKGLVDLLRGLDRSVEFTIANGIWYAPSYPFHQSFLATGKQWFDAEIAALDFTKPAASGTINAWVSQRTNDRIKKLVPDDLSDFVMVLVNAIYFKGAWREKFDPAETRDAPFTAADGSRQTVKLMHREGTFLHARGEDGSEAATLTYGNGAFAMTILLPPPTVTAPNPATYQHIDAFAASLTPAKWTAWQQAMHEVSMDLYVPKFRLEWERELKPDLQALGMRDAFDERLANFKRMTTGDVYIDFVKQKTFVEVNEEGTEAAAATAVGVRPTSLAPSFRVDRPFVFAIHERLSGTVLFIGKVTKLP